MKRWILVLLCICATPLVIAGDPEKEIRLKKGDIIYAFVPLSWKVPSTQTGLFPAGHVRCSSLRCRYTVSACEPLHVTDQGGGWTSVLPGDADMQTNLLVARNLRGMHVMRNLSGGSSPRKKRQWTLSRDECLAKIGKQPSPQPVPSASPAPTPQR